jgi:hypothetical protein
MLFCAGYLFWIRFEMGPGNAIQVKRQEIDIIMHPHKKKCSESKYKALIKDIFDRQKRIREAIQELGN